MLCAFPFFVLSVYGKDSKEPISFWSGDTTLKSKLRNVKAYNEEMAALADMYQDYIDGKKELREINMEFHARYIKGDDMPGRNGCAYQNQGTIW